MSPVEEEISEKLPRARSRRMDVSAAISRGVAALQARQSPDGCWKSRPDMGPIGLAIAVLCEGWLGALSPEDARGAIETLKRRQEPDGGFVLHPFTKDATLGATAVCRAALKMCGAPDSDPAVRAAEAQIRLLGGYGRLRERMESAGEPAAMFCAMVGLVPPDVLPPLTPDAAALPWSERMLDGRFNAGVPMMAYAVAAVRERLSPKNLLPRWMQAPTRLLARTRLSAFMSEYQNPDGSWNCAVFNTVFALIALDGVGMGPQDPMVRRGLEWLETRKLREGGCLEISVFDGENWETSLSLLALLECGVGRDDPSVEAGVRYLLQSQCRLPQPRCNQPRKGAPRTGGWAFQMGNDTMPDSDDTGIVLAALGSIAGEIAPREVFAAIDRGCTWVRGMQNPGGGFSGYVHGLPDKAPGALLPRPLPLRLHDIRALMALVADPPTELGDPAYADVTGRVLWGLGRCGADRDDPEVACALRFLARDACPSGAFWAMWSLPYITGSAYALIGMASVGALREPMAERAVRWLLSVQGRDGGWGETWSAVADPAQAGRGPSSPPATGLVLKALVDALEGGIGSPELHKAVDRAAKYLISAQQEDGSWENDGFFFVVIPPSFYAWDLHRLYYPLLGLGAWSRLR